VLSIAANIVSKHTSMVGVDLSNKDKVTGEAVQRQVPLMMSAQSAYVSMCTCTIWCHGNARSYLAMVDALINC